MRTLTDFINALQKPILFIQRTNYKKIETVMNLEGTVSKLVTGAVAACADERDLEILHTIRKLFDGFADLESDEKRRSVEEALKLLRCLDRDNDHSAGAGGGRWAFVDRIQELSTPIQFVKGVGPRIATLLRRKGIDTVEDALFFIPRDYEDRRTITPIAKATVGCRETIRGTIRRTNLVSYHRRRVLEMVIEDESGTIVAKWFNLNPSQLTYLKRRFKNGQQVIFSGKIDVFRYQKEVSHPDMELIDEDKNDHLHFGRIVPKYSETEGLYQKTLRRIMKNVVDTYARTVPDALPRALCRKQKLVDCAVAFGHVHFPDNRDDYAGLVAGKSPYHRRIVFDEFFFLELGLALRKRGNVLERGISFHSGGTLLNTFEQMLPFSLTAAQKRVIEEIRVDMAKPHPMNRLVQGDVGSGKTLVAFAAALVAIESGFQVAMMAPTELLAEQHYLNLRAMAGGLDIRSAFLSSSTRGTERDAVYRDSSNGTIDIVIGTHAVIQESVEFRQLGLGIIDEQHRFGVMQRASLKKKGTNPDVLVMTATPIPRTLALTVYGDLDVSVIDELPPGRVPIKTKVIFEKDRQQVYKLIQDEIEKGLQAYIVYPLIEESEKQDLMAATQMFEHLKQNVFPHCRLGLLHGRMRSEEKEEVMEQFKSGALQILVATTVIEVGIDVPQATLMVVEHAERFGLSQLHLLRGRVGRGEHQSLCILVAQ